MRTGEVFALTWEDVDFENRTIRINKTVYCKIKDNEGRWFLGTTKTVSSSRIIYMCDTLYEILSKIKKYQDINRRFYKSKYKYYYLEQVKNKYGKLIEYKIIEGNNKKKNIEMVFVKKDGTYVGTDIIKYPYRIIHKELKINCRFYDLRGSFATKVLRSGIEIKDISTVLGHSKIETTENYYITSTKATLKKVCESFEKEIDLKIISKNIIDN